jgi:hypothetical protein
MILGGRDQDLELGRVEESCGSPRFAGRTLLCFSTGGEAHSQNQPRKSAAIARVDHCPDEDGIGAQVGRKTTLGYPRAAKAKSSPRMEGDEEGSAGWPQAEAGGHLGFRLQGWAMISRTHHQAYNRRALPEVAQPAAVTSFLHSLPFECSFRATLRFPSSLRE